MFFLEHNGALFSRFTRTSWGACKLLSCLHHKESIFVSHTYNCQIVRANYFSLTFLEHFKPCFQIQTIAPGRCILQVCFRNSFGKKWPCVLKYCIRLCHSRSSVTRPTTSEYLNRTAVTPVSIRVGLYQHFWDI